MNPTVLLAEESSESTERRKETSLWYLAPRSWHANAMAGSWRTEGMGINSPWGGNQAAGDSQDRGRG